MMQPENGWRVYEGFSDWRVFLYQHIREMHPDALEVLLGDMKQTMGRIEAMQTEVKARHKVRQQGEGQ